MKKWNYFLYAGLLLSACTFLPSCSDKDDTTSPNPDVPVDPVDPPVDETSGLGANTPTPISFAKHLKADGGKEGVSIEVKDIKNETFTFSLTPGSLIQSYKLDVYPVPQLYNYMFEAKKIKPEATAEELIIDALFNTTGSGGYSFSVNSLGDDWNEFELNWAESKYRQFDIVPDAEYAIIAVGCFDEQAMEPADISLCYLKTTTEEIIGEPKVYIEAKGFYKSAYVVFSGNEDTQYYYSFCSETEEINEFIDAYGNDTFIDLMRSIYQSPNDFNDESQIHGLSWSWTDPKPGLSLTATAIALDMNKTKGEFSSQEFHLQEVPADAKPAEYTVRIKDVSARRVDFYIDLDVSTNVMFFNTILKSEWDAIKDSPTSKAALKQSLMDGGYAVDNRPFQNEGVEFNTQTNYNYPLSENSEYVVVSVARNRYMDYTDPVASESFTTKTLESNAPESSLAEAKVSLSDPGRTSFRATYEFNEETALYYHQCIIDKSMIDEFNAGNDTRLKNYLTDVSKMCSIWPVFDGETSDYFAFEGMTSNHTYYYAMVSEDWNGVLSSVSVDSITTLPVIGGPNPEMKIQSLVNEQGEWVVNFAIVKDVTNHRYMVFDDIYSEDPDFTYEDCLDYWKEIVIGEQGFSSVNSGTIVFKYGKSTRYAALCVPYGVDADGKDVMGDLYVQMFDLRIDPSDPTKCIVTQDRIKDVFFGSSKSARSSISCGAAMQAVKSIAKKRLSAQDIPAEKSVVDSYVSGEKMIHFSLKKAGMAPKIMTK